MYDAFYVKNAFCFYGDKYICKYIEKGLEGCMPDS